MTFHYLQENIKTIFKDFIYLFLERGEGREKERGRNIYVQERHRLVASQLQLGTWPITQVCALTENRTGDPLVCRLALSPLSNTSQGQSCFFSCENDLYYYPFVT